MSNTVPDTDVGEHAGEQLAYLLSATNTGARCALVTVVGVEDTASRSVGAHMVVTEYGRFAGSVSSGCIDANVASLALQSLRSRESKRIRLGSGSCFADIVLPCGGGIDLLIVPDPDIAAIAMACESLLARTPCSLAISEFGVRFTARAPGDSTLCGGEFIARYEPDLQFILAGRGAELTRFCEIARACGYGVSALSPAMTDVESCRALGADGHHLIDPDHVPVPDADQWTAFVMLFHDHDWEPGLLRAAVESRAFYIGALGSKRAQSTRIEMLRRSGVREGDLARIHGPIGVVPSMRNSPMLAISVLAEVIDHFQQALSSRESRAPSKMPGISDHLQNDRIRADGDSCTTRLFTS